jgi:hypothetical protein
MTGKITRIWCIVFLTLISVILGINSSSLTAFAQDENNPEAEENTQVLDEFSPSPLESTEPDPLLPNPPPVGEILSETEQEKLAPELDKLNADYTMPFEIPTMELKLNNLCNLKCRMCHPMDSTSWNDWKEVEEFYVAEEGNAINKSQYLAVEKIFPHASKIAIPHSSLKEKVKGAKAVIRTGDFSPYSNVILSSGVSFSNYSSIIPEA